jgi:hypothetical protein
VVDDAGSEVTAFEAKRFGIGRVSNPPLQVVGVSTSDGDGLMILRTLERVDHGTPVR